MEAAYELRRPHHHKEGTPCTARVALYDIKSGTFDEVVTLAKAGMVPMFQRSDGFVSYGVAQIDKNSFVSLSTWETRAQAHTATRKGRGLGQDQRS